MVSCSCSHPRSISNGAVACAKLTSDNTLRDCKLFRDLSVHASRVHSADDRQVTRRKDVMWWLFCNNMVVGDRLSPSQSSMRSLMISGAKADSNLESIWLCCVSALGVQISIGHCAVSFHDYRCRGWLQFRINLILLLVWPWHFPSFSSVQCKVFSVTISLQCTIFFVSLVVLFLSFDAVRSMYDPKCL